MLDKDPEDQSVRDEKRRHNCGHDKEGGPQTPHSGKVVGDIHERTDKPNYPYRSVRRFIDLTKGWSS